MVGLESNHVSDEEFKEKLWNTGALSRVVKTNLIENWKSGLGVKLVALTGLDRF